MNTENMNILTALSDCKKNNVNLNIQVHDRVKILSQCKVYVDIKPVEGTILQASCMTRLEVHSSDVKVLYHQLRYH